MDILVQSQINIVLSILLVILLGHAYFNMNRKKLTNKLFLWITGLTSFTLILEISSILLNNQNLKQFLVFHKLVNLIGFIVTPIIPFIGYQFTKEWVNRFQKEKIKANHILLLPLIVNSIGALLSYNGGQIFFITSNNVYKRGPLFFILPCVSYIYLGYNLYFIYKQRKKLTYSEIGIFSLFYCVPIVFTIVQLIYPIYPTIWSSTAMVIVIFYIFILNDQSHRDSLTGLQNRLSYEHYAENIDIKKINKLFMIYIDIDEFKTINDEYGHSEGDEAIKEFAKLLVQSFPIVKKKLIRLGGDEFLILLEEQQRKKVVRFMKNLEENVNKYNHSGAKPYNLKFSHGMLGYTNASENMYQLFDRADQMMYEEKQCKRNSTN